MLILNKSVKPTANAWPVAPKALNLKDFLEHFCRGRRDFRHRVAMNKALVAPAKITYKIPNLQYFSHSCYNLTDLFRLINRLLLGLLLSSSLTAADLGPQPDVQKTFLEPLNAALKKAKTAQLIRKKRSLDASFSKQLQEKALLKAPLMQSNLRVAGKPPVIHWRANGTPRMIQGNLLSAAQRRKVNQERDDLTTAKLFLNLNRSIFKIKHPDQELLFHQQTDDSLLKTKRFRFHQQYQGLAVWPSEMAVHINAVGDVIGMSGNYAPTPRRPLHSQPAITAKQARQIIKQRYQLESLDSTPELIIFNRANNQASNSLVTKPSSRLAWRIELELAVDRKLLLIIDASNGKLLTEFNQVHKNATTGSGIDLHGKSRRINLYQQDNQFFLIDTSKPMFSGQSAPNPQQGSIFIYDWENHSIDVNYSPRVVFSSQTDGFFLADGVSAAFNLSEVYDYYWQRHGRNSLDGNGGSMLGIVRFGVDYPNALWTGNLMLFGDGLPFASSLDVVGHELTHGVIQNSANLVYENQSGALNEAFADIFGEMAQSRTLGKTDWLAGGEDLNGIIVRSFSQPEKYNQPSKMSDYVQLPNTEEGDNGGVHVNSGIINHAFYQLAEGLPNAIGTEKAEKIFYRALSTYLLRNSEFIDARLATLKSAEDLYGKNSTAYQKVAEAFTKVEIIEQQPGTITPSSFPPVSSGSDAYLMACLTNLGRVKMCRFDPELGDTGLQIISDGELKQTRMSVMANGELAAFIDTFNDLCIVIPEEGSEACLGFNATFHSVAMSADGNRIALTTLDFFGSIEKSIAIIDLKNDREWSCAVTAPTIDSSDKLDTILVLDSLAFASDGNTLFYDAKNRFQDAAGESIETWTIYEMDTDDCQIKQLVQPAPGKDIGFPSLAQSSDNFLVHDVYDADSGVLEVKSINLNRGETQTITSLSSNFSVPVYNGDDSAIAFMFPQIQSALGYQTVQIPLANDRMTAAGNIASLFEQTAYPVIYRHGTYSGQLDVASYYDLETQILRAYVDYDSGGQTQTYSADLKLIKEDQKGLYFALINSQEIGAGEVPLRGKLNSDFSVEIPRASVTDSQGNTIFYQYRLSRYNDKAYMGFFMPFNSLVPL